MQDTVFKGIITMSSTRTIILQNYLYNDWNNRITLWNTYVPKYLAYAAVYAQ